MPHRHGAPRRFLRVVAARVVVALLGALLGILQLPAPDLDTALDVLSRGRPGDQIAHGRLAPGFGPIRDLQALEQVEEHRRQPTPVRTRQPGELGARLQQV